MQVRQPFSRGRVDTAVLGNYNREIGWQIDSFAGKGRGFVETVKKRTRRWPAAVVVAALLLALLLLSLIHI